jgi:uncharacterized protein (DUF2249 family)
MAMRRSGRAIETDELVPIEPGWKISEVLKRYPDLLESFIEMSPAFARLRNPALRRVQSRLVTVEQAAGIAGIDPISLVQHLNSAIGLGYAAEANESSLPADTSEADRPAWATPDNVAIDLDVRPVHERGEEPFAAIMEAVRDTPVGGVLLLHNTFDPVPLYDLLGVRGFEHWTHQERQDSWKIWFRRTRPDRAPADAAPQAGHDLDWSRPTAEVTIDVSELVPPEPMIKILEALETMPPGGVLLVRHVRRPMHLYPRLDEMGYRHDTREIEPGRVEVLIERTASDDRKTA